MQRISTLQRGFAPFTPELSNALCGTSRQFSGPALSMP